MFDGSAWTTNLLIVVSAVDQAPVDCKQTVTCIIPDGVFAKLQYRVSGPNPWIDSIPGPGDPPSGFLDAAAWASGQDHYTGPSGNYDLQLVAIDTGCGVLTTRGLSYVQTENCV